MYGPGGRPSAKHSVAARPNPVVAGRLLGPCESDRYTLAILSNHRLRDRDAKGIPRK